MPRGARALTALLLLLTLITRTAVAQDVRLGDVAPEETTVVAALAVELGQLRAKAEGGEEGEGRGSRVGTTSLST
jgi:hypothetical protein